MTTTKPKGFSLIELLIVVAIILIIAAIAIPNLLRARIAANESSAAASVRTIVTSDLAYQNAYQTYAASISVLGPPSSTGCPGGPTTANACILDYQLASATVANPKSGYYFTVVTPSPLQFFIQGHPASVGSSGVKGFCATEDNAVRFNNPDAAIADHNACIALLPVIGN
jgi:type IV pilus assembly protein PilA